ncbi:hypothetical protein FIU94_12945 [Sulfitobacter sp. THAF37]|uniref:hypothetical protein n=1 Tax=Sulfitobacter sp. THAF37 TaxID=2587855 RepID=UPI0012689830|nr:hypothetical protein [Sulfitobacter sp. THAF37]QFT59734.1 hypothetical protein FIU94_12945 [Sulfitobacter sp. THAF37]
MNQIINMIVRQVMHQLVRRGVSAGFNQASKVGKRRRQPELDQDGNPVQQRQLTPEERAERRARRQARQNNGHAKQSMKAMRRFSKF